MQEPSQLPASKLIVAGGGTGGHIFAGVAVADEWRARYGAQAPVLFVGAQGRIEEKLVPRAGYPLTLLRLGSLKGVSLAKRLRTMMLLPWSLIRSAAIVLRERPQVVIGVGGYASGPLVLMARFLGFFGLTRARTAILEQNSVPGFTNRILGRFVHRVFCAFPGTESRFPAGRASVTGNPIRSALRRLPAAPREPFVIFIFGGSQGALGVNTLVLSALPLLGDLRGRLRFIHQTGEADHARVAESYRAAGVDARVEKFIHDMKGAYSEASLLICRAGSSTLSEIAAVGRASVLVPLPTASDNQQEKNARVFTDSGAAFLLRQQDSRGEDLARLIRELLAEPSAISRMEEAVTRFDRPHAARDIVATLSG